MSEPSPAGRAVVQAGENFGPSYVLLQRLLGGRRRILVATSGGPDSQALLHWSHAAAKALQLVHLGGAGIDHGLRPAAAAELDHAGALCRRLGLPFVGARLGPLGPGNVLQAARKGRYAALRRLAQKCGADAILVAHSQNDQAETVLQHLARGAGLRGARGMVAARGRHPRFVRPWLGVDRPQILAYLTAHELPYAVDPSNADAQRTRTRIRHSVLPALEAAYPGAGARLAAFAAHVSCEEAYLTARSVRLLRSCSGEGGGIVLPAMLRLHPVMQARVLALWLQRAGAELRRASVQRLLEQLKARRPQQPLAEAALAGLWLTIARTSARGEEMLCVLPVNQVVPRRGARQTAASAPSLAPAIALSDGVSVELAGWRVAAELVVLRGASKAQKKALQQACADATAHVVAFATHSPHVCLELRSWRQGDRLRPFGLNGAASVSDLLSNRKVAQHGRAGWPVALLNQEVAWVVGVRRGCQALLDGAAPMAWLLRAERHENLGA